ncbi:MAG: glutaredoxin-related protein [Prevotella sp.]|nr:glutaredoxin-related protein [Prevotella sp.]MDY4218263.1 glutaredoxin-related protein [Prevotella sp.]
MIKIYGMKSCPDCVVVDEQAKNDEHYQIIDIGEHVRYLKEFLKLRDSHPAFADARAKGYAGIPCFVLEDGTVTLNPEEAGLSSSPVSGSSCRLDGSGC